MNSKIIISNLSVQAKIGCLPWEQAVTQKIILDIEITLTLPKKISLENTVDYDLLCNKITCFIQSKRYQLLESLATELMNKILEIPQISNCKLALNKPAALRHGKASVVIRSD